MERMTTDVYHRDSPGHCIHSMDHEHKERSRASQGRFGQGRSHDRSSFALGSPFRARSLPSPLSPPASGLRPSRTLVPLVRLLPACAPRPVPGLSPACPRPEPSSPLSSFFLRYNDESIIITQADIDGSGFVDAAEVGRWLQAMRKAGKIRDERLTAEELIKRYDKGGKVSGTHEWHA